MINSRTDAVENNIIRPLCCVNSRCECSTMLRKLLDGTIDSDADIPSHSFREVVAAPIIMVLLSLLVVTLRCWVKRVMLHKFALDDWLLVYSFTLFAALCIMVIYSDTQGFGVHSDEMSDENLRVIFRVFSSYINQSKC